MKFLILFQAFATSVIAKEYSYSQQDSFITSSPSPYSKGAFAFEPENVQKIEAGKVPVVAVEIPDKTSLKYAYPNLRLVNDSSELLNEEEKTIASNGTLISGVHSRYRGRSMRSPYQTMRMAYPQQYPSGMYYGGRYRYNRFDDRNAMESGDGSPSSSSWGSGWFNKLRRRTSMMMSPSPMMMSSYDKQMMSQGQGTAEEPDMSATFLGGWGAPSHYGKGGVNKSAVGLLGFLSLLSLIQNVLNQTSSATGGRRRRDLEEVTLLGDNQYDYSADNFEQPEKETELVISLVLPMLNDVSKAELGLIPVECVLHSICLANRALVNRLGENGTVLGAILSESTSKTLRRAAIKWKSNQIDISERVFRAGKAGRIGKNCEEKFRKYRKGCQRQSPNFDFDLKTILRFMENLNLDQNEDIDISQYF